MDRATGRWAAHAPAGTDPMAPPSPPYSPPSRSPSSTETPFSTAAVGQLILAVHVNLIAETDPADDHTGEAVAAFRRADWAFTTVTLQIDSWGPLAASWIGPRLGLPTDLTIIEHRYHGVTWGRQGKLVGLYAWTGVRPVAVLDDEHGGKDPDHAQQRTAEGIPTLLVPVDGYTGLRRHDIDQMHAWLDTLPRPARQMPPARDPPRPTP